MTLLYQPISRTFGQRDGCLTPNTNQEDKSHVSRVEPKSKIVILGSTVPNMSSTHEILSPPLSPYQSTSQDAGDDFSAALQTKNYLTSAHPFRIENFKSYSLNIDPWRNLNTNYKQKQLGFLEQYSTGTAKESTSRYSRYVERRVEKRKAGPRSISSDSESESVERVRTRRLVKENHAPLSEFESSNENSVPSTPLAKKRKARREVSYATSPLAAQQAALIDESIPDYSPDPASTLPSDNNRALKIEWKGQPMDLRDDPDIGKLHPAEVVLASTLRLRCNVYLDSKRRLFHEKVSRARDNMPFRRTDAQKACRIDVNKASRLFAAFEKVGWLDDKHFKKYL